MSHPVDRYERIRSNSFSPSLIAPIVLVVQCITAIKFSGRVRLAKQYSVMTQERNISHYLSKVYGSRIMIAMIYSSLFHSSLDRISTSPVSMATIFLTCPTS